MALVPCAAVSVGFIVLTLFLAEAARKTIDALMPNVSLTKTAALEFIAAAEMCGCGFELIIVADNYGVWSYGVCLFLLTIWWSQHWGEATACPYFHFEACLDGLMSILEVTVRTVAEVAGGLAVFRYTQLLWGLELAETHLGRPHAAAFDKCSADLTVPVLYGALIEGVATMLCRCTSKLLSDNEPQYATAIDSFVATGLVIAAFDTSGGYFNPVLATGLKFGCRGHSALEHVVVYWIGASAGACAAKFIYPAVKGALAPSRDEAKKEE